MNRNYYKANKKEVLDATTAFDSHHLMAKEEISFKANT
jgi:hypothetical protein